MSSDYFYMSEELYESCDVCGRWHTVKIVNLPESGIYPDGWEPEYDEQEETVGYVIKIRRVNSDEYEVGFVKEENVAAIIDAMELDERVATFGITYMGSKGYYQTQLYKYGISEIRQEKKA
jgi:hypothetical protein